MTAIEDLLLLLLLTGYCFADADDEKKYNHMSLCSDQLGKKEVFAIKEY